MTSFIGVYDKVLSSGDCGFVVNEFGVSSGELINQRFSEAALNSHYIKSAVYESMHKYVAKFMPFVESMHHFNVDDEYTFQKYEKGAQSKLWQCEHTPLASHRILAWQIFLNDAVGMEFLNYRNVRGRIGRVLIWPAGWTHRHRSAPNNKGDKYVANGGVSFQHRTG